MEFCAGGDLAGYIRRCKRVPEGTACAVMRQLGAGLKELWSRHMVHVSIKLAALPLLYSQRDARLTHMTSELLYSLERTQHLCLLQTPAGYCSHTTTSGCVCCLQRDLKPQNLLLSDHSPQAVLKIADFGFARHLQQHQLADTLCGSPLYMAPEILKSHKYDAKADLWSVGTILYELVVGRPPFNGSNHVALLHNIERHEAKIPDQIARILSPACIDLIYSLLKRNPVQRISFEEFFNHPFLAATAPLASTAHGKLPATHPPMHESGRDSF